MKITDKFQMYDLLKRGRLGNTTQIWRSLDELMSSGFPGPLGIRYLEWGRIRQRPYQTEEVPDAVERFLRQGLLQSRMIFHQWPPPESVILNAECLRSERFIELTYTYHSDKKVGQQYAHGLEAVQIIKWAGGAETWGIVNDLFEDYPDSAVDFTVHNIAVGRENIYTVTWDVRNY